MANVEVFDSFFRRADGRSSGQEAGGFFQGAGLPQMTLAKRREPNLQGHARNRMISRMAGEAYDGLQALLERLTYLKWSPRAVKNPLRTASILLVARHPEVYEPCDDSFALVDALLAEKANLLEQRPCFCVEVGCGSGFVITSLALILGDAVNAQFIATDISRTAAQVTRETFSAHGVQADVVVTDLVHGLEKRLAGSVDVLLFNPPYVPTPEHEVGAAGITATWAGGERGRVVIDRMLTIVDKLLSKKGWFYMITLTANNPSEICQIMKSKGFESRIVIQRYTEEENLLVLKFWRETC